MRLTKEQQKMVEESLPLVKSEARKIRRNLPRSIELDELISAGSEGLIIAVMNLREEVGHSTTYLRIRISGAIMDYLREIDPVGRKARAVCKQIEALRKEAGYEVDDLALFEATGLDARRAEKNLQLTQSAMTISIDTVMPGSRPLHDTISDPHADVMEERVLQEEHRQLMYECADRVLTPRLRLIFGLYYAEGIKQKKIGGLLGVTESRISQQLKAATQEVITAMEQEKGHGRKLPTKSVVLSALPTLPDTPHEHPGLPLLKQLAASGLAPGAHSINKGEIKVRLLENIRQALMQALDVEEYSVLVGCLFHNKPPSECGVGVPLSARRFDLILKIAQHKALVALRSQPDHATPNRAPPPKSEDPVWTEVARELTHYRAQEPHSDDVAANLALIRLHELFGLNGERVRPSAIASLCAPIIEKKCEEAERMVLSRTVFGNEALEDFADTEGFSLGEARLLRSRALAGLACGIDRVMRLVFSKIT